MVKQLGMEPAMALTRAVCEWVTKEQQGADNPDGMD